MEWLFGGRRSGDEIVQGQFRSLIVQRPASAFDGAAVFFVGEDAAFDGGGARAFAAAFEFAFLDGFFFGSFCAGAQGFSEAFAGEGAVLGLGTGVLDGDDYAGRDVAQGDFGGDFVDVLAARTGGAVEVFFEVGFLKGKLRRLVHRR